MQKLSDQIKKPPDQLQSRRTEAQTTKACDAIFIAIETERSKTYARAHAWRRNDAMCDFYMSLKLILRLACHFHRIRPKTARPQQTMAFSETRA